MTAASHAPDYVSELMHAEETRLADHDYEDYHRLRFDYLVRLIRERFPERALRFIDVGRSKLSVLLSEHYDSVTTLGFPLSEQETFGHEQGSVPLRGRFDGHIVYNLNDAQNGVQIETDQRFDVLVCAEVLEHLYTAPELTIKALASIVRPGGHLLFQTPNATALHKRLMLVLGRNPYERIRINNKNPGHFREYTRRELYEVARHAGLDVVFHEYVDYFGVSGSQAKRLALRAVNLVGAVLPTLRRGQTIILRKPV